MKEDFNPYDVYWTPRASKNLDKIVNYLEKEWSVKSADDFLKEINRIVNQIRAYPYSCEESSSKGIRRAYPHPKTALIYKVKSQLQRIEIINIIGTSQLIKR